MKEKVNLFFIRLIPLFLKKLWITFYLSFTNAMTNKKKVLFLGIKLWLVIAMLLAWRSVYDQLPEQMPMHRNIHGQVDKYWTKLGGVLSIPLIVLGMIVLFRFLPKIDPKKANYEKFWNTWEILQFGLIGFMIYVYGVSLLITLYPGYSINTFMLAWLWILFMFLGNYMGKIKHNFFVGIKTPWTISNEIVWNKTHRFAGWLWVLGGLVFFIQAFILKYIAATFIAVLLVIVLIPMIYSYFLFKQTNRS